jgi:ABC-2 type transport system permease protein
MINNGKFTRAIFDGLRGALIDRATIGIGLDAIVLAVVASIFLVLGARAFSKIQV